MAGEKARRWARRKKGTRMRGRGRGGMKVSLLPSLVAVKKAVGEGGGEKEESSKNCVESRQPKQGSCFPLVGIIPNYSKVMKQFANINCLFQKDIKKSFGIVCGIQRMFLENAFFLFLFFLSDTLSLGKELFV